MKKSKKDTTLYSGCCCCIVLLLIVISLFMLFLSFITSHITTDPQAPITPTPTIQHQGSSITT